MPSFLATLCTRFCSHTPGHMGDLPSLPGNKRSLPLAPLHSIQRCNIIRISGGTGTVRQEPSVFTLARRSVPLYTVFLISSTSSFQLSAVKPKTSEVRGPSEILCCASLIRTRLPVGSLPKLEYG